MTTKTHRRKITVAIECESVEISGFDLSYEETGPNTCMQDSESVDSTEGYPLPYS